ncbi:hypothetical protein M758_8G006200 [Ceratodon purpureus]|nr:hypothetical protein M758_8G006200 [Ceratodon purpureus]
MWTCGTPSCTNCCHLLPLDHLLTTMSISCYKSAFMLDSHQISITTASSILVNNCLPTCKSYRAPISCQYWSSCVRCNINALHQHQNPQRSHQEYPQYLEISSVHNDKVLQKGPRCPKSSNLILHN